MTDVASTSAHDGLLTDGWTVRERQADRVTYHQAARRGYTAVAADPATLHLMMADYDRHGAPPDYDRAAGRR